MSNSFDLAEPDLFTAGTIGPPGQRVFFLQAHEAGVLMTLKCEKQQVGALADYLAGILSNLPTPEEGVVPGELELVEPIDPEWVVGRLAVAWDEPSDRVVLVAEELLEEEADEPEATPATARVHITREQAAGFIGRARDLFETGRPLCPICGGPIDPDGHMCPRTNGHRRS